MSIRLLLMLCLLAVSPVQAGNGFPPPPKARVDNVGDENQALGMQLSIRRFETDSAPEQVLAFYRKLWKGRVAESEMSPWRMIGRLVDDRYQNVQVQAASGGGSWGYLSISDLPEQARKKRYAPDAMGGQFPRMSGSRVLDDQHSRDPGKEGQTLLLVNGFSVNSNASFYRQHYQGQGWRLVLDEAVATRREGQVLAFTRTGERLILAINRSEEQTQVVANLEKVRVLPW